MSDTLEISTDILRAALPSVSTEATRYYLNGVYFDPDGWIVSTNGHVMFAAQVPAVASWDGRGRIFAGKPLALALKGRGEVATLVLQGLDALVSLGAARTLVPEIDGAFPSWRRVIPVDCGVSEVPAHFLPDPLATIAKIGAALKEIPMIVPRDDALAPHPVVFGKNTDAFAVIMPARFMGAHPSAIWANRVRP